MWIVIVSILTWSGSPSAQPSDIEIKPLPDREICERVALGINIAGGGHLGARCVWR